MKNKESRAQELFNLGFRSQEVAGWSYLRADWGNGISATLDFNGSGTYRCMITSPSSGRQGRMASGRSEDPLEAVREAVRLAGLAYVGAVRTLEDRCKEMGACLSTLVAVKEKLDLNAPKEK